MKVFISSTYQDSQVPGAERHLAIRRALWEKGRARGHTMWVAEYSNRELTSQTPWREIVDTCVAGVVDCDLLIALLFRRWGAAIPVDDAGPSATSFLEIELFHAAPRRVPVVFLEVEDFQPDPELARLIEVLKSVTRGEQWLRVPERELEAKALAVIDAVAAKDLAPPSLVALPDALSDERSFRRLPDELRSTRLSLLGRFGPSTEAASYSGDRAGALLADARRLGSDGPLNYADRLSRLWMALRELSKLPAEALDPRALAAWTEVADLWASPAAWLQLHGPLRLGVLAALQTKGDLNGRYRPNVEPPYGAFASEAYSIGKVSHTSGWRSRRFRAAQVLATRQAERLADPSGAWLIRGSATLQLARLGRPWLVPAGRADYVRAVKFRERAGASASALGEAMVELAFADYALGRAIFWLRADALARMREGVRLLEEDHPERRPGFVKRAKEKLAVALEQQGLHDEAAVQRAQLAAFNPAHGLPAP
jgi:hypothetical protein